MKLTATIHGDRFEFEVSCEGDSLRVGQTVVALDGQAGPIRTAFLDSKRIEFGWTRRGNAYEIVIEGIEYRVDVCDELSERALFLARSASQTTGESTVRAPIPGLVRRVLVTEGQSVAKDQPVLTLDAMKLENELAAPREGIVKKILVTTGTPVERDQALLVIQSGPPV